MLLIDEFRRGLRSSVNFRRFKTIFRRLFFRSTAFRMKEFIEMLLGLFIFEVSERVRLELLSEDKETYVDRIEHSDWCTPGSSLETLFSYPLILMRPFAATRLNPGRSA